MPFTHPKLCFVANFTEIFRSYTKSERIAGIWRCFGNQRNSLQKLCNFFRQESSQYPQDCSCLYHMQSCVRFSTQFFSWVPSGLCSLSIFFLRFYSTSSAYPPFTEGLRLFFDGRSTTCTGRVAWRAFAAAAC